MLNDESGAESSVSTAATSIDSAATAVSDSINMYDWYFISPLTPTERQEAKYTTHHNHNYIPQITQISVTEVLELAKSGSSSFEGEGVTLIYATEEEAWDDKKMDISLLTTSATQLLQLHLRQCLFILQPLF